MPDAPTTPDILAQLEAREAALVEELATVRRMLAVARGLTMREQSASSGSMDKQTMPQFLKVKHSQGKSADRLVTVATAAGKSLRDLAKRVGCSGPLLTQARKQPGDPQFRTISMRLALKIQEETRSKAFPDGFEATRENWPGLRE